MLVSCGCATGCVFIWSRDKAQLITKIEAHGSIVNFISWNPQNPNLFATASDDRTIKIYGIKDYSM